MFAINSNDYCEFTKPTPREYKISACSVKVPKSAAQAVAEERAVKTEKKLVSASCTHTCFHERGGRLIAMVYSQNNRVLE